jgi:hypothetical protein
MIYKRTPMKVVQTLWFDNSKELNGGWLTTQFHLMSWALSALSFSRFYPNLELVTDNIGADLLFENLKLPYSQVSLEQESFKPSVDKLWVLRKIYSYTLQNDPFIHADGDTYLFKPFDEELLSAPLVAQNYEYNHPYYIEGYNEIVNYCNYLPPHIKSREENRISAVNAGILGGNNFSFFKDFSTQIDIFIEQNKDCLGKLSPYYLNIILEQFLFKQIAEEQNIPITYLIKEEIGYPHYYGLDRFYDLPNDVNYLHTMNYKQNPLICEQMAQRLFIEDTELYYRCVKVSKSLEATHHFIDKKTYERTFLVADTIGLTIKNIENDVKTNQKQQLNDVFDYENTKSKSIKYLKKINWDVYSNVVNKVLSQPKENYLRAKIKQSEFCFRIVSEWDWSENNEFSGQGANKNLLANLETDPAYFEVVLYHYKHLDIIREHLLDAWSITILDESEYKISINELVSTIWTQVSIYQPISEKENIEKMLIERIKLFLYQGILQFM